MPPLRYSSSYPSMPPAGSSSIPPSGYPEMPSSAPFPDMLPPGYSSMQATQDMHSAYLAAVEQRCMSGHTASRPSSESPLSETTPSPRISRLNIRVSSSEASPVSLTPFHGPNPPPPRHVDLPPPGHADRIKKYVSLLKGKGFTLLHWLQM